MDFETVFEPGSDLIETISDGLEQPDLSKVGGWECHHLAVLARKDGEIVGGVYGTAQWDWLGIELAWVKASERQRGVGSQLLGTLEKAAVAKGHLNAHVRTRNWQTLNFYQKRDYETFGQLEGYPKGHTTYFLKKALGVEAQPSTVG